MSTVLEDKPVEKLLAPSSPRADTLAASVVVLLVMTVMQRVIGFGRGIMFCRWLDPEQIGQWDVALGFLNLAAPLVVFGLPGSFGRYVEYFRGRGQFQVFLRRTAVVTLLASIVATIVIIVERNWFSQLIFGSTEKTALVVWLAVCLALVVGHNFLVVLFIAVRRYRVVTALQFLQSLGFAAISLGLLALWPLGATTVVIGYGAATLLSAIAAICWLRHLTGGEAVSAEPIPQVTFWTKLVPFATWIWITNLLANLFEVIDRYMIVHHSGMDGHEALRQVGIYHSSRLVPLLFVAVAGLLGSMVTPHLSHDWEAGRRNEVVGLLNTMLKTLLISLFGASLAVLFVAPWLFEFAFPSQFHAGLAILPWTLAYCVWFGTIAVALNYLWCAERAALGSLALLVGLLLSIGLNWFLVPRFGLEGAVWATSAANLVTLLLTYQFSRSSGMHIDPGTWILSLVPLSLGLGPWVSLIVLVVVSITVLTSDHIFSREEKQQLLDSAAHALRKLRGADRNSTAAHSPAMTR